MPDDEPLDDARAVGMAAAAATAKIVETAARAAADRDNRPRHDPTAAPAERRLGELAEAERWAAAENPERLQHYYAERNGALRGAQVDTDRLRGAETSLVEDWQRTTGARPGSGVDSDSELEQAVRWAEAESPGVWNRFKDDMRWSESTDGRESGERQLVRAWKQKATEPYDSPERRAGADSALKAAGVADEPRKARTTSDLLNGADPRTAAAAGKTAKPAAAPTKARAPEQVRTR